MSSAPHTSGIYKIACLTTSKVYIGSTRNLIFRWRIHRAHLRRGNHCNAHLQGAWNKYGEQMFKFEVIELCAIDALIEREDYWITAYQAADRRYGYNLAPSAIRGASPSEETRAKMRAKAIGKTHDETTRQRMSETHARLAATKEGREAKRRAAVARWGQPSQSKPKRIKPPTQTRGDRHIISEETRAKLSAANRGKCLSLEHRAKIAASSVRRGISQETRAKMIASRRANGGWKVSPETRAKQGALSAKTWICLDPDGNEYQVVNLTAFCHARGLSPSCMMRVASGKRQTHKGWRCRHSHS